MTTVATTEPSWALMTTVATTEQSWALMTTVATTEQSWALMTAVATTEQSWALINNCGDHGTVFSGQFFFICCHVCHTLAIQSVIRNKYNIIPEI